MAHSWPLDDQFAMWIIMTVFAWALTTWHVISQSVICLYMTVSNGGRTLPQKTVHLSQDLNTFEGLTLASQRSFLWKTNELFSHLSYWKPHKCELKPSEHGSFFQDNQFEGSCAYVYSKNECFPIYLLGNPINVCWNPQNRTHFSETINLRGHSLGLL